MNKEQILAAIRSLAAQGSISKTEIDDAYEQGAAQNGHGVISSAKKIGIGEVLYYIGGAIIFIGISILIFQHWDSLNNFTRILSTLGAAVVAYLLGVSLHKNQAFGSLGQAFFLISALVLPIGLAVSFHILGMDVGEPGANTLIAAISLGVFWISLFIYQRTIFALFTIIFGTWLFFALTAWIVGGSPVWDSKFFEYRSLVTGASYLLFGYAFSQGMHKKLSSWLYSFGVIFFLGAALALGGYSPGASAFWEVIFVGLVFGIMFLSVYLKSKPMLIFGAIFLMIYVIKITAEYFSETLGWPFALIIAGLGLIGIGYLAYYLNNKYIKS